MSYSKIRDLNGTKENWAIQARLCRIWEAVDFKNNNEVFALETVFVDDQGDSIQGYVRKNHIMRFKPMFKEGEVYAIRNFKVARSSVQYKVVPNNQRIYFNVTTSVRAITPVANQIPPHVFYFVPQDVLDDRVGNNTNLTDIIGCVVAVGPIEIVATGPKKGIELKNNRNGLMRMTLWGNISSMFDLAPYELAATPVIAILISTTIRKFKVEFSYGSTTATRIYFNLELPEVNVLSQTFADGYEGIKTLQHGSGGPVPLAEQASLNRTTIRQLLAMEWASGNQEHFCTFVGEIVEIDQRYKIHARAQDSTGSTTLVIFNDDVEKFVKAPASNFMGRVGTGDKDLPHEISNLIGKTFVFKIKVTDYNLKDGFENYTVTKIFEEGGADHKRKLKDGNATTHVVPSNGIDRATSSGDNPIPPITPQKETLELKKIKREE